MSWLSDWFTLGHLASGSGRGPQAKQVTRLELHETPHACNTPSHGCTLNHSELTARKAHLRQRRRIQLRLIRVLHPTPLLAVCGHASLHQAYLLEKCRVS